MLNENKKSPQLCEDLGSCCGCTACVSVCPTGAIVLNPDENGFPYPVVDRDKCVRCGKCMRICAFKKDSAQKSVQTPRGVYAVRLKDSYTVRNSSSGGAFTAISDWVLQECGVVASPVYDYTTHELKYRLYSDKAIRDEARGSKYVHPILGDIFDQCIGWIRENPGKPLLFVGLGCHVAGLNEVLVDNNLRQQAILVDLICHGTPSPQLWKDYVRHLELIHGGATDYVTFKDKRKGWEEPYAFVRIAGQEVGLDSYSYWFYESFSQRESCFSCPYTKLHRDSDLTIGDFWGVNKTLPDFYSPGGNSLVLVQTERGECLFRAIMDTIKFEQSDTASCLQPRLVTPGSPNPKRDRFWFDYQKKGIPYLIKRYHENGKFKTACKKGIRLGKRVLRKLLGLTRK